MDSSKVDGEVLPSAADKLDEALESRDIRKFLAELSQTIRKRGGYTAAAAGTGFNRTALYKIVSPDGNPTVGTLSSLLAHLGLRLSVQPLDGGGQSIVTPLKKEVH